MTAGRVSAVLLVVAGLGFVALHAAGGDPYDPEGPLQHLSFGLPLVSAGVLALIGFARGRPWLMLAGGVAAVPICVVSFVGLPVLVCAGFVIAAAASRLDRPAPHELLVAIVAVVLLVGSFFYEVLHQDPAEWTTPDGSAGSSNIVTTTESLVVLVACGLALALAFASARTADRTVRTPQRVAG